MLKRNIFAAPFADYFDACQKKKELGTLEVKYRGDEAVYLKTEQDRCICIFNVHFIDKDDQLLGKVFIEEFVYARKALPSAPSCSFSLVEPPRELEGKRVIDCDFFFPKLFVFCRNRRCGVQREPGFCVLCAASGAPGQESQHHLEYSDF
jgi:actin related protein 2/3 complex subunit 2